MSRRSFPAGTALLVLLAGIAAAVPPADRIASLYAAGSLAEAAELADSLAAAGETGTDLLVWRYRLATEPSVARRLALELLAREDLVPAGRREILHDLAATELAADRPDAALRWLDRLARAGGDESPDHGVLAGQAHMIRGDPDAARDALAAVRPEEAEFCRARYLLGELALKEKDAGLARHYWETALHRGESSCRPDLLAALVRLEAAADSTEAQRLAARLRDAAPGALALLTLPTSLFRAAPTSPNEAVTSGGSQTVTTGGFALQLGAFRDRGRALALQRRWEPVLGELRVVSGSAADGRIVHRVRSPVLPDRAAAEKLARRWRHDTSFQPVIVREETLRP